MKHINTMYAIFYCHTNVLSNQKQTRDPYPNVTYKYNIYLKCGIQNSVCHVCTAIPNSYSTALEPSPSVTLYVAHNLYPLPYDPTILPQSQPIFCIFF